jgi:hypothetical protein
VDALAAGARGFHSWIDEDYGLVFTFATERTVFSNVEELSSMMHLAILQEVGVPGDFDFDGVVTGRDFLAWQRNPSLGDLAEWQDAYGGSTPAEAGSPVPEPGTWHLISFVLIGLRRRDTFRA